jgi:hypothetical protein
MYEDDKRKEIIAKAIINPEFRQRLFADPERVFEVKKLSETDMAALQRMRKMLPAMDDLVSSLAGEVLCGGGGGCGGLA